MINLKPYLLLPQGNVDMKKMIQLAFLVSLSKQIYTE